jgi:hypothetical protein
VKLKPVQTYPAIMLRGRVPGELHAVLTAYTAYYRESTGQAIELWPLVVLILQQFMDTDRDFQVWRRRTQNGPGAGPTTGS